MLAIPDKAIASSVSSAFDAFRSNVVQMVPEIFAQESANNQSEIQSWWSNLNNTVPVVVGYPLQQVTAPIVAVTMEPEQEIAPKQSIGSQSGVFVAATGQDGNATYFRGQYNVHAMGINQNWVLWLQALVRWALLYQRRTLQEMPPTGAGLFRQVLSSSGFIPVPDSLRDSVYPFQRVVSLSADRLDTWAGVPASLSSTTSVTLEVSDATP